MYRLRASQSAFLRSLEPKARGGNQTCHEHRNANLCAGAGVSASYAIYAFSWRRPPMPKAAGD